jgi:hypothetical protein
MTIKLNGSTAGSVALDAPASTTGNADIQFKLPVADGTAGQVLTTDGSGNLSWANDKGKILQIVQTHYSGRVSQSIASGGEWAPSQLNTTITPSATTSKVLITAKVAVGCDVGQRIIYMSCYRGSTQIAQGDASGNNIISMSSAAYMHFDNTVADIVFQFLDTPSTTSATTYSFRFLHSQTGTMTLYINRGGSSVANRVQDGYLSSNVTLQEVSA